MCEAVSRRWCRHVRRVRPPALAHQPLRVSLHDVVAQFTHDLESEAFVEGARPRVERRHAQEDVRRLAVNPGLGEFQQRTAHTP